MGPGCVYVCVSSWYAPYTHELLFPISLQVNPPYYIPLVEIIPAPWTSQSVIDRTTEIMKDLGQAPVRAKKEINGFIVNRLQYALIMEAWRLVEVRWQVVVWFYKINVHTLKYGSMLQCLDRPVVGVGTVAMVHGVS